MSEPKYEIDATQSNPQLKVPSKPTRVADILNPKDQARGLKIDPTFYQSYENVTATPQKSKGEEKSPSGDVGQTLEESAEMSDNTTPTPQPQPVKEEPSKPIEVVAPPLVEQPVDISDVDDPKEADDLPLSEDEVAEMDLAFSGDENEDVPLTLDEAKWIQKAIKHPGALRKSLGVPEGHPIPLSKLRAAAKKGGKLGRRARLALTLRKLRKGRKAELDAAFTKAVVDIVKPEGIMDAIKQGFESLKELLKPKPEVEKPKEEVAKAVEAEPVAKESAPKVEEVKVEVKVEEIALPEKVEEAGKGVVEPAAAVEVKPKDYREVICEAFRARKSRGEANFLTGFMDEISKKIVTPEGKIKEARTVQEANEFTTSTGGSAIPTVWSDEVVRLLDRYAVLEQACVSYPDLEGKPGSTVYIPTLAAVVWAAGTEIAEPTGLTPAVSAVPCVVAERVGYLKISKWVFEDAKPDLISKLNEELAVGASYDFDGRILTYLGDPVAAAPLKGTLAESGILAGTVIAKVAGSLRAATCEPYWMIIHPVQEASLLQDTQFTNAATYGSREIIQSGRVYDYVGIHLMVSPQVTSTGGTYVSYMWSKNAIAVAGKRAMTIETDYRPETRLNYLVGSRRYGATMVLPQQIHKVTTVNG